MAPGPRLRASLSGLLTLGLVLLVSGAADAQGDANENGSATIPPSTSNTTKAPVNIPAIVAPTVILGLLLLAGVAVAVVLRVKKRRQTEGTYRPSSEEQSGVSSVQAPDALKLPKEERLI